MDKYKIVCANCNVPVEGKSGEGEADIFSCPECGVNDTRANVMEEAKAYAVEHAARGLQQSLKNTASKSKIMTYKPGHIETRDYRFIVVPA
jgi:hypothetical protein